MTRKRSAYHPRPVSAPMLVNRGLIGDELEMRERMIAEAFTGGWATSEHFDNLADMRNVMTLAAAYKNDTQAQELCSAMRILMANIRERHAKTGKFGVTGEERKFLQVFAEVYRDFWMRQPVKLYEMACDELNKFHALPKKEAA